MFYYIQNVFLMKTILSTMSLKPINFVIFSSTSFDSNETFI